MNIIRYGGLLLALLATCGCSSTDGTPSNANMLIPSRQLNVSDSLTLTAENIAVGALAFAIIDPLAPNWSIEQTRIDANHYRIALKMKRFTAGGEGEAYQVFRRCAERIAHSNANAVSSYRVVEFTEGIESTVPVAQRVAQGVVEVLH